MYDKTDQTTLYLSCHTAVDVKLILTLFAGLPFTLLPKIMISGSSSDDCRHHYV